MKTKLKVMIGMAALAIALIGCGDQAAEAGKEKAFKLISKDDDSELLEYQHVETGCHYLKYSGHRKGNITQMFIEKNGVSVPYCEDTKGESQ